jgi:hypothetical protein
VPARALVSRAQQPGRWRPGRSSQGGGRGAAGGARERRPGRRSLGAAGGQ